MMYLFPFLSDCSSDNGQFCFTRSTEIGTEVGTVIATSCLGVDCTDSNCNQAVQSVSCLIINVCIMFNCLWTQK